MQEVYKLDPANYSIWIEAECWDATSTIFDDIDTDVIVEWDNGERWMASFLTYKHVSTLAKRYQSNGECLNGAYIWMSDMILIDIATRDRIEDVIQHLLLTDDFQILFTRIPPDEAEALP